LDVPLYFLVFNTIKSILLAWRQWLCNPSYSADRDQEDRGLKPALDKQFPRPYLNNILQEKGLVE
jgi:hypothetical protein